MTRKKTPIAGKVKLNVEFKCGPACREMHTFGDDCIAIGSTGRAKHDDKIETDREGYLARRKERIEMLEPQVAPEEDLIEYEVKFSIPLELTDQAQFIVEEILPEFLTYFVRKNNSYAAAEKEFALSAITGTAGQWGELYRKVCMLKAPMWDHNHKHLEFEDARTLMMDLFGHLMLGAYYDVMAVTSDTDD